ncbi:MAG: saccharopine dehydrogenase [Parcubacteria group bacterium Gr01-1014_66]|nr:MAG: saccharopine dehydrogenase [Parcubacteria group bacterium Gr01-1014_66]
MQYDFLVLGADGMQGLIVTRDLLERGHSVFSADLYKTKIRKLLSAYPERMVFEYVDLRDIQMTINIIQKSGAQVVVNCADMDWNVNVYRACIETRTHCVDLGTWIEMTEEQLGFDPQFKKIKKTAITGCGSVPGIGNVMLKYAARKFDTLHSVDVGFVWDSNQKKFVVPFHMKSILEEFTYNPRYLKHGRWVETKPLKIIREAHHQLIGYQKSFLVQHPEIFTFFHYYKKIGLENVRFFAGFPPHSLEKIHTLIELGFHREKPIKIEGKEIAPIDLLSPVFKHMRIPRGYTESENLWVEIGGRHDRKEEKILMECLVPPLKGWEDAGSNIDTGFPAVIIAKMIKDNVIRQRGSFAPEAVVPERAFFAELRKKKLEVYENGKKIN